MSKPKVSKWYNADKLLPKLGVLVKKESKIGIKETKDYINKLPLSKRRKYNIALGNLIDMPRSNFLETLKAKIFKYISENEEKFNDEEIYLNSVSKLFDCNFGLEFSEEMKRVQYLLCYYTYASGGEL